jgi:hypothetical protein
MVGGIVAKLRVLAIGPGEAAAMRRSYASMMPASELKRLTWFRIDEQASHYSWTLDA